jgi:hypothetical protein
MVDVVGSPAGGIYAAMVRVIKRLDLTPELWSITNSWKVVACDVVWALPFLIISVVLAILMSCIV